MEQAFHWYVAPCDPNLTRYLDARLGDAKRLGAAPYASEWNFGASSVESADRFAQNIAAFETRKISYTGWQYKSYSGSLPNGTCTGCGNSFFWTNGSLNVHTMAGLRQPFAQRVAGTDVDIESSFAVAANASSASCAFVVSLSLTSHRITHLTPRNLSRITDTLTYKVTAAATPTVVVVPDLLWKDRGLTLSVHVSGGQKSIVHHDGFVVTPGVEVAGSSKVFVTHAKNEVDDLARVTIVAE